MAETLEAVKEIERHELKEKIDRHEPLVLLETLATEHFRHSHLPGAVNMPAIAIAIVVVFSGFLAASAVAISRRFYLIGTIIAGLARIGVLRGRLRPDMTWINRMEDLLLAVLRDRPARFFAIALIDVAAQALLVLELFWLLQALESVDTRLNA